MITDYEKLFAIGAPWPPEDQDTKERLARYERNENLFAGDHQEVWQDIIRALRGDRSGDLRLVLNFFKRLSLLWADLTCGEFPEAKAGDGKQPAQVVTLDRIIDDNALWPTISDAVIDLSKFGDAALKIRYQDRGIIENVPPEYWFPIVEPSNVKQVKAHVLAYSFDVQEESELPVIPVPTFIPADSHISEAQAKAVMEAGPFATGKTSYLKVEIHKPGSIEHRLYRLKDRKIESQLDLSTFDEFKSLEKVQETGLDDFALIIVHNITSTKKYHGMDDYSDIADIIRELEWRYAQIFRIEDKFSDPSMYGPPIEEQDPRDGEYKVTGGSRYITLNEGQTPPGMITWDGQLPANFLTIDGLMQRLYEISETCKVAFDASAGGQGMSAQALRIMMTAPLKKSNRLQTRLGPAVRKAIRLCSLIEVKMGMAGAVEIPVTELTFHDGLPQDHNADAQRESTLVTGKVRSHQGLMRDKGFSDAQIKQETEEMNNADMGIGGLDGMQEQEEEAEDAET